MASTSPSHKALLLPNEEETPRSTPKFRPPSPWMNSWDSSFGSSTFSSDEEFPPFSPATPLKFRGIPFSWEQIPGIPKHRTSEKKEPSEHLLPLPPAGNSKSSTKKLLHQEEISPKKGSRFQRDPFFAALVACSEDDHDHDRGTNFGGIWRGSSKITRSLSDRFGFLNMYTSCKRTCAVSESIVYLPRAGPHYLLNRRSS